MKTTIDFSLIDRVRGHYYKLDRDSDDYKREVLSVFENLPNPPPFENKEGNLQFRQLIRDFGDDDPITADAIWFKCASDPVWFINTFAWTQNPKDFRGDEVNQPVIMFPEQEKFLRSVHEHVECRNDGGGYGKPLLLKKSREQLATVMMTNYCLWRLFFTSAASIKIGSNKEDSVDGASYQNCSMPKIDYTISRLPDWLVPVGYRATAKKNPCRPYLKIKNPVSGYVIEGESTNSNFSVGGRYVLIWFDEFSVIESKMQEAVHIGIGNATNCYIYTTTPRGQDKFEDLVASGDIDVVHLHWTSNHYWQPKGYKPEELKWNPLTKEGMWPEEWLCKKNVCKVHPEGGMPHSERYDNECQKYGFDKIKIAQEFDMDAQKALETVFDIDMVRRCDNFLVEKEKSGELKFTYWHLDWDVSKEKQRDSYDIELGIMRSFGYASREWGIVANPVNTSNLKVFKTPFSCRDESCVCGGTGAHVYTLGGDTCRNTGGDYHCAYILDATAGEVVAEWHGHGDINDVAVEWGKLARWYGDASVKGFGSAYCVVERNGSGGQTANEILVYMGCEVHISKNMKAHGKKAKKGYYGLETLKHSKQYVIKECLIPAVNKPDVLNDSEYPIVFVPYRDFFRECITYIYDDKPNQEIKPEFATMRAQKRSDHDDRIMSLAMAIFAAKHLYYGVQNVKPTPRQKDLCSIRLKQRIVA